MRFLGVTETCDLLSLYLRLAADGHEVKVAVSDALAAGTGAGLIARVPDWRAELDWVRAAGRDGIILFESVSDGFGAAQDGLRAEGFNVVGGSAWGDRLENDRAFAQALLGKLGFPQGHVWEFGDAVAASTFIAARPARYVLKMSGPDHESGDNAIGRFTDGRDIRARLAATRVPTGGRFILMEHIDGTRFLRPACLDWEHKRFFAGDMGELTGEMGTVATFERSNRFFELTLARIEPLLCGHRHVGYVNLNTIVNTAGIWPLEFTCRFGYPGFAILDPLQATPWAELFRAMASGTGADLATLPGFSTGIVVTTPPFPYTRKLVDEPVGLPIHIDGEMTADDRANLHSGEVGRTGGELVTSGLYGWTMVVTGTGASIARSRDAAYRRTARVIVPNGRYRLDIGDRLITGEFARLDALGLLDSA